MEIFVPAINYSTGSLLYDPIDEKTFAEKVEELIPKRREELQNTSSMPTADVLFRAITAPRPPNLNDPLEAGWTYLINKDHPNLSEVQAALEPLAKHRGMKGDPLFFDDKANWHSWIEDNYSGINSDLSLRMPPHYILIIGDPKQVPFGLQALLDIQASVGRLDLTLEELDAYVHKVIRLELAEKTNITREALFFATNHGSSDPTYFSQNYMVKPLVEKAVNMGFKTESMLEKNDTTKKNFLKKLSVARPALVYTASHGVTDPSWNPEMHERMNGSIVDQTATLNQPLGPDCLIGADDIPFDKPFLEGSIFFQFACFGYGTSADDEFMYWVNNLFPSRQQKEMKFHKDFVAALPKRLLAHPHGPVAFIGHLHLACLQGFHDPNEHLFYERWHPRLEPFVYALESLLTFIPAGRALTRMNDRYASFSAELSKVFDRIQRSEMKEEEKNLALATSFIIRNDSQNYMVLGDPAARILIDE